MKYHLLIAYGWVICSEIVAQPVLKEIKFMNPSFEGNLPSPFDDQTWNKVPPFWTTCLTGSTPDTQPNAYGVTNPPSNGKTYLGIIARSNSSTEAVAQTLEMTLSKKSSYCFSIDLAFSDSRSYRIGEPVLLHVWGTNNNCDKNELLWTSPVIDHSEWKKYKICFSPEQTHTRLMFEAFYARPAIYYGYVLLDNLSSIEYLENWQKSICSGDSLQVSALPQGEKQQDWVITWKAGKNIPKDVVTEKIYIKKEGEYEAELRKGIRVYKSILTVEVNECEAKLVIPNLITPNGDRFNETFEIKGILPDKWKIKIYNRWGKEVFESEGYHNEWAGEANETGTYYYYLIDKESERKYTGYVTVMR